MWMLLGVILPPIIDLINRKITDTDLRFWISVAVCLAVGVIIDVIAHNGFNSYSYMTLTEVTESIAASALSVFGLAQITYKGFWENSGTRTDMGLNAKKQ